MLAMFKEWIPAGSYSLLVGIPHGAQRPLYYLKVANESSACYLHVEGLQKNGRTKGKLV